MLTPGEMFILRLLAFVGCVTLIGFIILLVMFFVKVFEIVDKMQDKK